MPCSKCQKNKGRYEVVGAGGKVLYQTDKSAVATAVASRYRGASVRDRGEK